MYAHLRECRYLCITRKFYPELSAKFKLINHIQK